MKRGIVLFLGLFLLCSAASVWAFLSVGNPQTDVVAVSRFVREVELNWERWDSLPDSFPNFTILDSSGTPLYWRGNSPTTLEESIRKNDLLLDLSSGDKTGKLLLSTGTAGQIQILSQRMAILSASMFLLAAVVTAGYFVYLRRRVFTPFQRMKRFASQVAAGNLDAPLQMDRGNLFGAFTESFDLMRDELRKARSRELQAQQQKKELVASLSHDIKTPVTSIKLQCELLEVTAPPVLADKLHEIKAKAEQIDSLITDLFHSTLEELGELRIHPAELESKALEKMLRDADYDRKLCTFALPDCLLRADPLRLEQVVDNLLFNSYKYAGTQILAEGSLSDEFLKLDLYDYGPGAEELEIPQLCKRFFRGKNACGKEGAGLGLYLSRTLMEKMDGELSCDNWEQGFHVELLIPLV